MSLPELAPRPPKRVPGDEGLLDGDRVGIAGRHEEGRHESAQVSRRRSSQRLLPHRPDTRGAVHDDQGIGRGIDPRRLQLVDDVAGVLEGPPCFADAVLDLGRAPPARRIELETASPMTAGIASAVRPEDERAGVGLRLGRRLARCRVLRGVARTLGQVPT